MNFIIGLILLILLLSAIKSFARLDAAAVARAVRNGAGVLGLVLAAILLLRGRVGIAAALAGMAASFAGWQKFGQGFTGAFGSGWSGFRSAGGAGRSAGRVSTARSAMLEVRLDHDSGTMTGVVLGGRFAGRELGALARPELIGLRAELGRDDPDGVALLETYLDRRFAGWRDADEGEAEPRRGASGAMTRREALETLGLAEGASAEDIVRAHRDLMKKFHPDRGGSTGLAARVNQAKDVLTQRRG